MGNMKILVTDRQTEGQTEGILKDQTCWSKNHYKSLKITRNNWNSLEIT